MQFNSILPSTLNVFWQAAEANDLDALDSLFQQNPTLATCTRADGSTLLHEAVRRKNTVAAANLIVHGSDLEAKDNTGITASLRAWGDGNLLMASCFNMSTFIRFKPQVEPVLNNLVECAPKTLSISDQFLRLSIKPPEVDPYKIDFRPIRKIVLLCKIDKTTNSFDSKSIQGAALLVKFTDKTRKVYTFKQENQYIHLFHLLVQSNAIAEKSHFFQGCEQRMIDWTAVDDTNQLYAQSKDCEMFYERINEYAAVKIAVAFTSTDTIGQRARQHGVALYSFGCGKAKDLIATKIALSKFQIQCTAIGIDCNPDANLNAKKHEITIIKGDMRNLQTLLSPLANQKTVKAGMFVGSLVRQCLKGTEEAVRVMHQVKDFDILFLTGFTDVLINKAMAKAMGWRPEIANSTCFADETAIHRVRPTQSDQHKNIDIRGMYQLKRMCDTERKAYLKKRGIKRTQAQAFHSLDLSMSSAPLNDMKLFTKKELQDIKLIDLSWCALTSLDVSDLFKFIDTFDTKLKIVISGTEDWLPDAQKFLQQPFIQRKDFVANEVAALSPFEARLFGFYQTLPNKLFKFIDSTG